MKMKRRNTTTALLCALIGLMIIAGFAIARPIPAPVEETEPVIEAVETGETGETEATAEDEPIEFPKWLDFIMRNIWPFLAGVLATLGISLAFGFKFLRELGEVLLAIANFGEGTGTWDDVKKEIVELIQLFRDKSPVHTIQAIGKTRAIKKGKRHIS